MSSFTPSSSLALTTSTPTLPFPNRDRDLSLFHWTLLAPPIDVSLLFEGPLSLGPVSATFPNRSSLVLLESKKDCLFHPTQTIVRSGPHDTSSLHSVEYGLSVRTTNECPSACRHFRRSPTDSLDRIGPDPSWRRVTEFFNLDKKSDESGSEKGSRTGLPFAGEKMKRTRTFSSSWGGTRKVLIRSGKSEAGQGEVGETRVEVVTSPCLTDEVGVVRPLKFVDDPGVQSRRRCCRHSSNFPPLSFPILLYLHTFLFSSRSVTYKTPKQGVRLN